MKASEQWSAPRCAECANNPISRRQALRLVGTAVGAALLAACTHGGSKANSTSSGAPTTNAAPGSSSGAVPTGTASAGTATATTTTATAPATATTTGAATTTAAPSTSAGAPSFDALAKNLSGKLTRKGSAGYDAGALLYNPRFAKQAGPQAIAACANAADVAACVQFAAAGGAPLRIRNGGHSYGGWSSGPGLVADLAAMKSVQVDVKASTATVGAGARLDDVYSALAARGVAIGAGSCPTVGITGLTLGGGVGVLTRAYGLTCDQVQSFDVVTADGKAARVDAHHQPDLFWALRGGGGSFAAVTALTLRVHQAPKIVRFYLQWSWAHAADVVAAWQEWVAHAPRELWSTCKLLADPGTTGLKVTVSGTWIGSGSLASVLAPLLKKLPHPGTDTRKSATYGATMAAEAGCADLDPAQCTAQALSFTKRQPFAATSSVVAKALPAAGIAAAVDAVGNAMKVAPGVLIEAGMSFDALGGAVADVKPADTAFPWRGALALVQHTATWQPSAAGHDPAPFDGFVRGARSALKPWTGTSAYLNYADASITDFGVAYWGSNLSRLRQVKRTVDAHNVFSSAQSVQP